MADCESLKTPRDPNHAAFLAIKKEFDVLPFDAKYINRGNRFRRLKDGTRIRVEYYESPTTVDSNVAVPTLLIKATKQGKPPFWFSISQKGLIAAGSIKRIGVSFDKPIAHPFSENQKYWDLVSKSGMSYLSNETNYRNAAQILVSWTKQMLTENTFINPPVEFVEKEIPHEKYHHHT